MSRTYRNKQGKLPRNIARRSRNRRTFEEGRACVYRNAKRVMCSSSMAQKWLFKTRGAAEEAVKYNLEQREGRDDEGKFERPYHCKACGGWHLTHYSVSGWLDRKREIARVYGTDVDEFGNFIDESKIPRPKPDGSGIL